MPGFKINSFGSGSDPNSDQKLKPFYSYTWELESVVGSYANDQEKALVHCQSITMPTFSVKEEQVLGSSLTYKYASEINWEPVQITWYDTIGLGPIVRSWRDKIWTTKSGLGVAGEYKRDTTIRNYTYDYINDTSKVWKLYGSWPSSIKEGDLTYASSDFKIISVSLSYDFAEESIYNDPPDNAAPQSFESAFPQ